MNLITETKNKIKYHTDKVEELQECLLLGFLTNDARHYINDEITKAKRNVEYYTQILNKLKE